MGSPVRICAAVCAVLERVGIADLPPRELCALDPASALRHGGVGGAGLYDHGAKGVEVARRTIVGVDLGGRAEFVSSRLVFPIPLLPAGRTFGSSVRPGDQRLDGEIHGSTAGDGSVRSP